MAYLFKKGKIIPLELRVIADNEGLQIDDEFKNSIKKSIGGGNYFEYIGKGDQKLNISAFIKDKTEYDELIEFFSDGKPFTLLLNDISANYNLIGSVSARQTYLPITPSPVALQGTTGFTVEAPQYSYIVNFQITSAQDPSFNDDIFLGDLGIDKPPTLSALDKLRAWGKNTIKFVGDVNQKVGAITGKFAQYATAINQLTAGIASSSSIITSPISSVKNSISSIIGGVSSIVSAIGTAINAVKQLPDDIDGMIDAMLAIGEQFSNLFNSPNKDEQVKNTINLLIDVSIALTNVDKAPIEIKVITEDPYSVEFDAGIFVATLDNTNNDVMSVLILSSILLAIYNQSSLINRWNKKDLDNLLKQSETLFEYIINKDLATEVRTALIDARNAFFKSFKVLYQEADSIIEVFLEEPKFLYDVVYSVNGNYDYYNDTKKLNNIIGSVVIGKILVIAND